MLRAFLSWAYAALSHISIKLRLRIMIYTIAVNVLGLGVYTYYQLTALDHQVADFSEQYLAMQRAAKRVQLRLEETLYQNYEATMKQESAAAHAELSATRGQILSDLQALQGLVQQYDNRHAAQLEDNVRAIRRYLDASLQLQNNPDSDSEANLKTLHEEVDPQYKQAREGFNALVQALEADADQAQADTRATIHHVQDRLVTATTIILSVGVFYAFMILRSIFTSMARVTQQYVEIKEESNLARRIDYTGRDEIRTMSDSVNNMFEKFHGILLDVADSTSQLSSASIHMKDITEDTNRGVVRQQSELEMVVAAINEMAATVAEVSQNTDLARKAAEDASSQAHSGKGVVEQTVSNINNLAGEVQRVATVIHELEQKSSNINSVIAVIQEIAEQTNLLALNAAIEAARAGEQGRGFAVVADEVRTLANRTQESTHEINQIIHEFRDVTKQAVATMEQSRHQAQDSVAQATVAGQSLDEITRAVTEINEMIHYIAQAMDGQSIAAEEVNKNIIAINDVSHQTLAHANETAAASEQLAQLSDKLSNQVSQFRL